VQNLKGVSSLITSARELDCHRLLEYRYREEKVTQMSHHDYRIRVFPGSRDHRVRFHAERRNFLSGLCVNPPASAARFGHPESQLQVENEHTSTRKKNSWSFVGNFEDIVLGSVWVSRDHWQVEPAKFRKRKPLISASFVRIKHRNIEM